MLGLDVHVDVRALLEEARAHLEAHDVAAAFDMLLEAWRACRASEIASLCELLSNRVAQAATKIGSTTHRQHLHEWPNAFSECTPLGLGVLLADFVTLLSANLTARLVLPIAAAIATVRDDPRTSAAAIRGLGRVTESGPHWQKVSLRYFEAIEGAQDPRAIAELDYLCRAAITPILLRVPQTRAMLLERFPDGPPKLPPDIELLARTIGTTILAVDQTNILARARLTKGHKSGVIVENSTTGNPAALLHAVYESPDDMALRVVLADALTERGDPRGELIVLQAQRHGKSTLSTKKASQREHALLKKHMREWLGPLAHVVVMNTAVFEHGFLSRCVAHAKNELTADLHFHYLEWATVRSIEFRAASRITTAMRALREAGPLDEHGLRHLVAHGHPTLERLRIRMDLMRGGAPVGDVAEAFASCTTLPSLTDLTFLIGDAEWDGSGRRSRGASDYAWIWSTPWGGQLRRLRIPCRMRYDEWAALLVSRAKTSSLRTIEILPAMTIMTTIEINEDDHDTLRVILAWGQWAGGLVGEGSTATTYLVSAIIDCIARFGSCGSVRDLRIEGSPNMTFSKEHRAIIMTRMRQFPALRSVTYPWSK